MSATKIAVIGAGSASFGPGIIADLLKAEGLKGSTLALVDIDPQGLELVARLARRMNDEWGAGCQIEAATERKQALPGCEFAVVSVAVEREKRWRMDYEIPLRYGIKQPLAENAGPGGLAHALRNIPILMAIARDMESLCPGALMVNFTNPVPRLCRAVSRYTGVSVVGLCHGIGMAQDSIARVLELPPEEVDLTAAGINHFTWVLEARRRSTGEDLYPPLRDRLRDYDPNFMPLTRRLMDLFGLWPSPSDDHVAEFLPYFHLEQTGAWERYKLHPYDWDGSERYRDRTWEKIRTWADGKGTIDELRRGTIERAAQIIEAIATGAESRELAVNIPNDGSVSNLPDWACVEIPARIHDRAIEGVNVGSLPEPIAELCRRQIAIMELVVEAGVTGSRQAALQALLLDPTINDMDAAEKLLDDLLAAHAELLPQFGTPNPR